MGKDGQLIVKARGSGKQPAAPSNDAGKGTVTEAGEATAEQPEGNDAAEPDNEEDEGEDERAAEDQDQDGQDDERGDDLDDLVQVLTVTARRLASVNLGRKFTSELKKKTACAVSGHLTLVTMKSGQVMERPSKNPNQAAIRSTLCLQRKMSSMAWFCWLRGTWHGLSADMLRTQVAPRTPRPPQHVRP